MITEVILEMTDPKEFAPIHEWCVQTFGDYVQHEDGPIPDWTWVAKGFGVKFLFFNERDAMIFRLRWV